ncbi:uncharacterized protein LOC108054007 [Drosophila rhopaloa]|uniref:Uncharacterized protein LOC108054007 n=1 Tax=Drosophila rhopaloa TaxID=1041015 RepID=A0A6P4FR89_DRORH|nr:uncharacterized protein LOC108054007 [Drosophila rhopaloa]
MEDDTEYAFKQHEAIIPQVIEAYDEAIQQIFADLSSSDLDVCAAILEENEDSCLDTTQIINSTRRLMTKIVLDVNQCFFAGSDVRTKLTTLEMLKEQFSNHEGKDWNFHSVSPEELTRPLRMHSLDLSIRFIERQLKVQEMELKIAIGNSKANRQIIRDVQSDRVKLGVMIQEQMAGYQEIKPQLIEIERSINDSHLPSEM